MNSFQFFWGALVLDWKGFQELQCLQLENHFYAPFGFLLCPGVCSFAKREHLREGKLCWGGGEEAEIGPGDLSGLRWREAEFRRRLDQGARTAFGAREQALEARAGVCVRVWCDLEGHHPDYWKVLGGKDCKCQFIYLHYKRLQSSLELRAGVFRSPGLHRVLG